MLAVHTGLNELTLGVDIVQDSVCVRLVTGSEDDHLEHLVRFLQTLHQVGAKVDASADRLFIREINLQDNIRILCLDVVHTMDQCFVHVEDQDLLMFRCQWFRQLNEHVLNLFKWHDCQVVLDELQGCQGVLKMLLLDISLSTAVSFTRFLTHIVDLFFIFVDFPLVHGRIILRHLRHVLVQSVTGLLL